MPIDLHAPAPAVAPAALDLEARAFERAYDEVWLPVFRFALAWTNDWQAAEDLAQEAFLALWDRRLEVDWTTPVLPWLLVTTRRRATDRFRRLKRALAARPTVAPLPDPDARLEWLDLRAAFGALSALERSALVLTSIQDLDAAAAGEALGIEANAVRAAASRARRKLKVSR